MEELEIVNAMETMLFSFLKKILYLVQFYQINKAIFSWFLTSIKKNCLICAF